MISTHVQIVMASHVNGYDRLFGGQLMAWIDVTGAVAARRHAGNEVATVTVDNLEFLAPAKLNDTIVLDAVVTWTGKTSIEVRVDTYVEKLNGERNRINRAYMVFVAIDKDGHSTHVPTFTPLSSEEKEEWEGALKRREIRISRKSL